MLENPSLDCNALPKEVAFEEGTQLERSFNANPINFSRSSGFQKRCFEEGTSSTREDADNHQRFHLNASILSKGKEKLRKFSKDEDRVDSKGFKGFVHRGSSVMVFPTSPVTREKGFNFVGTCEMRVVENFEVSSTPHSQSFLSSLSSFPPSSGLALPPLSPFVPVLPSSVIQS